MVIASIGKIATVAPYSGHMFESVARSASERLARPGPKNSTNLPTTPCLRSRSVTVSTRSVAVVPAGNVPSRRKPTTGGISIEIGWPSIAASASMPPTPHPTTPSPFTIVVWESVPTSVSGYAHATPLRSARKTTRARYSRFTWCTMPVSGGTTRKLANAFCPQRRNV